MTNQTMSLTEVEPWTHVAINDEWWREHESEIGTFPSRRCSFQHSAEMVDRIYQELE